MAEVEVKEWSQSDADLLVTMLLTLTMSNNLDFCFVFEFVDQEKRTGQCWGSEDSGVFLDSVGEVQSRT